MTAERRAEREGVANTAGQPLRVAIIIGSIRKGRFGPVAAGWIATHAGLRGDLDVDVIDLAEALRIHRARQPYPS